MRPHRHRSGLVRGVVVANIALVIVGMGAPSAGVARAGAAGAQDVTVSAAPRWGGVGPGRWTPYSIVLSNEGGTGVDGEVVLVPQPEPPAKPGARPTTPVTVPGVTTTTVLAVGGRAVTGPAPRGPAANAEPRWPTYRTPVALPAGTSKTLTVMVLEAPFGYRVEVHDATRGRLARAAGPAPGTGELTRIMLLSDVAGADATLEAMPRQLEAPLKVSQLSTARDFPDNPILLAGLHAVVIDDFDTATLTERQRRALQDYVSLGGALVVTGGAAWSRTTEALPRQLVPLRVTGSSLFPLAPLADLLAVTSDTTAAVATGELAAGQVVLGPPEAPLVVTSDYGAGMVVQLAYDPLAEPITSDEVLRGAAWDQGLLRVAERWGRFVFWSPPQVVEEDQLWAPALDARPWPPWSRWGLALAVLYAIGAGPLAFLVSRRRRAVGSWATLALAAVATTGVCLVVSGLRSSALETVVEVRALGADGAVLATTYRGVLDLDPDATVSLADGAAVSTVFTATPMFRSVSGHLDPLFRRQPGESPILRGPGRGSILTAGGGPALRLPAKAWQMRNVETVSVTAEPKGPALEAKLSLAGSSETSPGRVIGTVANRGTSAINKLRAQIPGAQAYLVDSLAAGETAEVDAPLVTVGGAPGKVLPAKADEAVMFAAANRAFTAPGQVAVVGVASARTRGTTALVRRISVVTSVVALQAADSLVSGSGGGRMVTASPTATSGSTAVYDLRVPPQVGPLSVRYQARLVLPGQAEPPPSSVEVYNWTTTAWRTLPASGRPQYAYVETPLEDGEVNDGLVRVRERNAAPLGRSSAPQLILTSTSTDAAVPG